jgi:hypothetical protein
MPTWNKIILSGSNAHLNSVTGSFSGDGSGIFGIISTSSSYAATSSYTEQLKSFGCGILGNSTAITTGFYNTKRIESKGEILNYRIDSFNSSGSPLSGSITYVVNKNNSFLGSASMDNLSTILDTNLAGWTSTNILPDDKIDFYVINNTSVTNSILTINYRQYT